MFIPNLKSAMQLLVLTVTVTGVWKASNPAAAASQKEEKRAREHELKRRLAATTTVQFVDVPLQQVVKDFQTLSGIHIILDRQALKRLGLNDQQPISLHAQNLSLKTVLRLTLAGVHGDLVAVINDGVLLVTDRQPEKAPVPAPKPLPNANRKPKVQLSIGLETKIYALKNGVKSCIVQSHLTTGEDKPASNTLGQQVPTEGKNGLLLFENDGLTLKIIVNIRKNGKVTLDVLFEKQQVMKKGTGQLIQGTFAHLIQTTNPGDWVTVEDRETSGKVRHVAEVRVTQIIAIEPKIRVLFSIEKKRR